VLTDQGAEIHHKGEIIAKGPLHAIRQFIDDEEQLHYLRRWQKLKQLKKKRRTRCRKAVIQRMMKMALRPTNEEIAA
jgi:hypothetical protein